MASSKDSTTSNKGLGATKLRNSLRTMRNLLRTMRNLLRTMRNPANRLCALG